ncbi:CoA transferase [Variovorax sp. AFSI2.2]|uniref:CoA transferase n=1 Tax=Variovorax sp. AFSI2.2 TaxID=3384160 RepID=UPI003EC0B3E6
MTEAELYGRDRPAIGNNIYGAFGRDFVTADGRRVMVAGISAGQWRALVAACDAELSIASIERVTGRDLSKEASRHESREEIADALAPWFAARTFIEVGAALDARNVCWGPYRTVTQLLNEDSRVGSRNPIYERVVTPGVGEHWAAGTPVRQIGTPRSAVRPAGLLGQDTDAVLAEVLRLSASEIGRLHDSGIVASSELDPTFSAAA